MQVDPVNFLTSRSGKGKMHFFCRLLPVLFDHTGEKFRAFELIVLALGCDFSLYHVFSPLAHG
jgi:hypothetical protein